ncbi:hypothetical protein PHMEG_00033502 [Phytophthora megakarya]|uniref:Uncharacterized protein n=1 Tax=Phytophthora megakarya TaxID=4795 RepID=A0A225UTE8_9STRA|nr:hypothetical protein PHMEG_00033502 [Phytophthora megakarya]
MFAFFDQAPTSSSLLMQCGYRSKVCTNERATKLDGTLHKLCEFHRRKANLNQQRLHKRQREERAAREMFKGIQDCVFVEERPVKKCRPNFEPIVDPIFCFKQEFTAIGSNDYFPVSAAGGPTLPKMQSRDNDFLEQLLFDMQSLPPLEIFTPTTSVTIDDSNTVIV